MGDNNGDTRAVTSGADPWGRHPPARWLCVGTGTRVTGGGCALGGIAKEARFALLTLGTLRVVLAVLGEDTCYSGVVILCCVPVLLAPCQPLPPYQAVPKNRVTGAGVAVAATARAGPQIRSPSHPLKTGGTVLA